MKRLISLGLLFLYAASVTGVSIKAFYCCDKLKSVTAVLYAEPEHACCKAKEKKAKAAGCCNTEYKFFKVRETHVSAAGASAPDKQVLEINQFDVVAVDVDQGLMSSGAGHPAHAPPLYSPTAIYILNCSYRI